MKIDTKGLLLAYVGCFILAGSFILESYYGINLTPHIALGCILTFVCIVIKDFDYWHYAMNKINPMKPFRLRSEDNNGS